MPDGVGGASCSSRTSAQGGEIQERILRPHAPVLKRSKETLLLGFELRLAGQVLELVRIGLEDRRALMNPPVAASPLDFPILSQRISFGHWKAGF